MHSNVNSIAKIRSPTKSLAPFKNMAVRACVCYSSGVWTADAFEGQRITSTAGA